MFSNIQGISADKYYEDSALELFRVGSAEALGEGTRE